MQVDGRGAEKVCWFPAPVSVLGKGRICLDRVADVYRGDDERMVEERFMELVESALRALGERAAYLEAVRRTETLQGRKELPAAKRRRH